MFYPPPALHTAAAGAARELALLLGRWRVVAGAVVLMTAAYFGLVRPWLLRWGATAGEVARPMPGRYFTARAPDQTVSWCLAVEPAGQCGCRVISRWRARWHVTPASAAWIALSEPGAFIMERRMLLGIRARAEQAAGDGHLRYSDAGQGRTLPNGRVSRPGSRPFVPAIGAVGSWPPGTLAG
jgi:hypothetical protein